MFQGLSTALTALYASRQALDTTGNNIANVNTEGYTRQRVELAPAGNGTIPSFWSSTLQAGTGVSVQTISRLRDQYLEVQSITEHGNQGKADKVASTLTSVEQAFGEPGDTGIQSQLADFWSTFDKLVIDPGGAAARSQVIETAATLTTGIRQSAGQLDTMRNQALDGLKGSVSKINALAANIADLNHAIQGAYSSGGNANSLLDQRDKLVQDMAKIANVTTLQGAFGSVTVSIGGTAIVRDDRVMGLQVDDSTTPIKLRWDNDNDPLTTNVGMVASVTGGDIGGAMESINNIIPSYKTQLDTIAVALINQVNTQHAAGLDAYGNAGGAFFTGTSAATIDISTALAGDPKLLAAAAAGGGPLDSENARALANLASLNTGVDAQYRQMIDVLGVQSQRATRQSAIQTTITNNVDAARDSVSGVNLDEEMTNMVQFQASYNASAKYLSVINEVLDTLLGMVR